MSRKAQTRRSAPRAAARSASARAVSARSAGARRGPAKPATKRATRTAARGSVRKRAPAPAKRARPSSTSASARPGSAISAKARAVSVLRYARSLTDKLVEGFAEHQVCYQPAMTDNHLIWTLGHVALTNQWFAGLLDGRPNTLPDSYGELFGYKSKPNPDVSVYPPLEEVRRAYDATYARLIRAADAMTEADMEAPPAGDSYGFVKDKGEVLEKAVWHEGWHSGQLSSLRRALALPPVMG